MNSKPGSERMIMTVLEASVAPDQWDTLRQKFAENSSRTPPQMVQSFLVQNAADPTMWQIIGIWRSRSALENYRQSTETPGGILMFRSVGAEPNLMILEVAAHAQPASVS